jgi:hypothetical protein
MVFFFFFFSVTAFRLAVCLLWPQIWESGVGQTWLGLDSGRFFFFDRLFASLLVLRSAHGVLGGSHYSAFFLIRSASARSFLLSRLLPFTVL